MNWVIVDTDILIDASRNIRQAIEMLQGLENQTRLAVSAITQMELLIGCQNKTELRVTKSFLNRFHIIRLNAQISDIAVNLLLQYRLSHGLLIADALIAATAIHLELPFVSKNQRDYRYIETLNLLPYP